MSDLLTELQCTQPPCYNCFRLIILGSAKVGKTAIVKRFLHSDFTDIYTPTIEDFHRKIYKIRGEAYQLDILDTSGIHPFPAMRRLSFLTGSYEFATIDCGDVVTQGKVREPGGATVNSARGGLTFFGHSNADELFEKKMFGDAFILVYSIDSRESFEEVLRLREQIVESIRSASANKSSKPKNIPIPMIIAGNKSDREAHRLVPAGEVSHMLQRSKDHVACVECSAKDNRNITDVFSTLFALADFPEEMIPNDSRRISLTHGGNVVPRRQCHGKGSSRRRHGLSLRRRLSDAYSALILNVRRPSIATDLVMVREKSEQNGTPRSKRRKNRSSVKKTDSQKLTAAELEAQKTTRSSQRRKTDAPSCTIL